MLSGAKRKVLLLIGLTVVAVSVALGAAVGFTYVQVRGELRSQAVHAVRNHLRSQQQIIIQNLRLIAESQKSLLNLYKTDDGVLPQRIRFLQRTFAHNQVSVRSSMVIAEDTEPIVAPSHLAEELRSTYTFDDADKPVAGPLAPIGEFQDAGGWYEGTPFPGSVGLRSILPIAVFDFSGVRPGLGAVVAVDISHILYNLIGDFSIVVGERAWPLEVALYDRDGMLLATTLNHLRQHYPILDPDTAATLLEDESNTVGRSRVPGLAPETVVVYRDGHITEVVHDEPTGLYLAGSVPEPAITQRVAYLSSQIIIIGMLCILVVSALGFMLLRAVQKLTTVERQRADLHARSIQSILGPHFLFNSLDTIVGLASRQDCDGLMRTLKALTIQLEGAVRNFDKEITVTQEIQYVFSYLEIQRQRYPGRFTAHIHVEPNTRFETIPRFCIQPVVENCFTHALPYCCNSMVISISVSEFDEDTIEVVVSDSGPGMSDSQKEALLAAFEREQDPERHGTGLYTVHQRLITAYGQQYGIRLFATDRAEYDTTGDDNGTGMTLAILLPKISNSLKQPREDSYEQ